MALNEHDIHVWVYSPKDKKLAVSAAAVGVLAKILANISAPMHAARPTNPARWNQRAMGRDKQAWEKLILSNFAEASTAEPLKAWSQFLGAALETVPDAVAPRALTQYFAELNRGQKGGKQAAVEESSRIVAGAMDDYASIVETCAARRVANLCDATGALVGSLRGARTGLDAVAECDCCGTAVSAGWILPLDPDPTRAHTQQQSGAEKGSPATAEVAREGEESVYAAVREARTEMCARLEEQLSEDWRKFDAPDENGERLSPPVPQWLGEAVQQAMKTHPIRACFKCAIPTIKAMATCTEETAVWREICALAQGRPTKLLRLPARKWGEQLDPFQLKGLNAHVGRGVIHDDKKGSIVLIGRKNPEEEPTVYVRFRATDGAATTATKLTTEEAKAAMALFDTDLRDKRRKTHGEGRQAPEVDKTDIARHILDEQPGQLIFGWGSEGQALTVELDSIFDSLPTIHNWTMSEAGRVMHSSMPHSSLTAPQKALFRKAREAYEFDFIRNFIESAQKPGEQHVVTKLERNKDASTTTATTFTLANLGGEALEAGPPPCEEWTLSYGQAEEGTVTRKKAQNHQNPPRYEEMVRLELWTNSMATNSSHDRYHSARPQTPLLPILIRARPGQRLTTPLTRDEKEQVETARAAAPQL